MTKKVLSDYEKYLIETNNLRKKYFGSSKYFGGSQQQQTNIQFKREQLLAAKQLDAITKTEAQNFYRYMALNNVNDKVQGKSVPNIPWWAELWECQLLFSPSLFLCAYIKLTTVHS